MTGGTALLLLLSPLALTGAAYVGTLVLDSAVDVCQKYKRTIEVDYRLHDVTYKLNETLKEVDKLKTRVDMLENILNRRG